MSRVLFGYPNLRRCGVLLLTLPGMAGARGSVDPAFVRVVVGVTRLTLMGGIGGVQLSFAGVVRDHVREAAGILTVGNAGPALSIPSVSELPRTQVVTRELVALGAVGAGQRKGCDRVAAEHVLTVCHRPDVEGIATSPSPVVASEVVQFQAIGDRADLAFVTRDMGRTEPPVRRAHLAVTVTASTAHPDVTPRPVVYPPDAGKAIGGLSLPKALTGFAVTTPDCLGVVRQFFRVPRNEDADHDTQDSAILIGEIA